MSQAFGRNRRLTRAAEFRRVYSKGRAYPTPFFVCHVLETGDPDAPSRLGLSASKRTGPSHDRVRYKRWAREVFRRHSLRSGADVVVSFRQAMASAGFAAFRAALIEVFERARLVKR